MTEEEVTKARENVESKIETPCVLSRDLNKMS
jgi:hypothetical protein